MNTGVRTSPCAVASTPARAAPSVAVRRNALIAQASPLSAPSGARHRHGSATNVQQPCGESVLEGAFRPRPADGPLRPCPVPGTATEVVRKREKTVTIRPHGAVLGLKG